MERDWQDYKALHGGVAGARIAFEKTCKKLFKAKFKGKKVSSVAVKHGDGGIDVFIGDLGVNPISVFQCKFFIENFDDAQKAQIRNSFDTAIKSPTYKMSDWNLCIPRELDVDNHKWWSTWAIKMNKEHKIPINLYDGDDLIEELKTLDLYNKEFGIDDKLQLDRIEKAVTKVEKKKSPLEHLITDIKDWFNVLGYSFENYEQINKSVFRTIINIQTRRGFDRIFILCTSDEIDSYHLGLIKTEIQNHKCVEGWLVTYNRISEAVKNELKTPGEISCFTFDELIDENINFSEYFSWIEKEVQEKGIDKRYIQLSCKKESLHPDTNQIIGKPSIYDKKNGYIEGYIKKWLDDPNKKHISVLGEFGTGKTWFSLHYTWLLLKEYLKDKNAGTKRCRLPIYIPLRDFAKTVSIESLFSEFFFRKHNSPIPSYKAFEMLNRMGKFVIVFDGFDEMADKVDKQKMINNFWELAKIAAIDNTKVMLTCRCEHFPQAQEGRSLLNAELQASIANLTGESPQFEVVELLKLSLEQIISILKFYTDEKTINIITKNKALLDLASRPLMSELIIAAIPDIEQGKKIDLSRIYLYAVSKKMQKDIKEERTFTSMSDKLFFMCELSWEMLSNDKMTINFKEFPERIRNLFSESVKEQKDLDHWHYDMMGQTLLIRNDDGDYKPAHRSLLEFFVAYKFAAELGVLPDDFIDIIRDNKNVDNKLPKKDYTWQEYFKKSTTKIAPLNSFKRTDYAFITQNFGKTLLTKAVLDIIKNIIPMSDISVQTKFLDIIDYCRKKKKDKINYLPQNIILLLVEYQYDFFNSKDLSNLIINDFRFPSRKKDESEREEEYYFSAFKFADMSNCSFENSDLANSNFGNPFYSFIRYVKSNMINCNFKKAKLDRFYLPDIQNNSFVLNPNNNDLIIGSHADIVILDTDFNVKRRIDSVEGWNSNISPDGKIFVHSGNGCIMFYDTVNYELLNMVEIYDQSTKKIIKTVSSGIGGLHFNKDSSLLFLACSNSFVYIIDIKKGEVINSFKCFEKSYKIVLSPDGGSLLIYNDYEFFIWDWQKNEKLYYLKEGDLNDLVYSNIQYHPVEDYFVVCKRQKVEIYDSNKNYVVRELDLQDMHHVCFIEQRDLMFISNGADMRVYQFSTLKLIDEFNIRAACLYGINRLYKNNSFDYGDRIFAKLINNVIVLYFGFSRNIAKYDYDNKTILDHYLHMIDFSGSDFTGAKGISEEMLKQLQKNGAIVDFKTDET